MLPSPLSRLSPLVVVLLAIACGLVATARQWYPNRWLHNDGAFYMNVTRGILEQGSLRQESLHPHSWYELDLGWNRDVDAAFSNIALGVHGEWWPKHPLLMPVAAVPFVWALGPIGALAFNLLGFVLMGLLVYRVATRLAPGWAAIAAAAIFLVSPFVMDQAWGFSNDVFYTVLVLGAVEAGLAGHGGWAGALLGVSFFAKFTNVLYGPAFLALFALRRDWRAVLRFCIAAAVPGVLFLGMNGAMFGSPLVTSYDRILVRSHGVMGLYSHAADFHWSKFGAGFQQHVLGPEGLWGRAPYAFLAIPALGVMAARRRWREALFLAWAIGVPILFHAPYSWYRLGFNLPQIALSLVPVAAAFGAASFAPEGWGRRPLGRIGLALAGILLVVGGARRATPDSHGYFWKELPRASVRLGETPCDYYNNQHERWECSGFDRSDWHFTGRAIHPRISFGGIPKEWVLLHPHPSGKERILTYPDVPMGRSLTIRYGLADSSRDGAQARFRVTVDETLVLDEVVSSKGMVERIVDTSGFPGRGRVVFSSVSGSPDWVHLAFDGGPTP